MACAEKKARKSEEAILLCSCGFGALRVFSITMEGDGLLLMDTEAGQVFAPANLCSFLVRREPLEEGQERRIIGFGGK